MFKERNKHSHFVQIKLLFYPNTTTFSGITSTPLSSTVIVITYNIVILFFPRVILNNNKIPQNLRNVSKCVVKTVHTSESEFRYGS